MDLSGSDIWVINPEDSNVSTCWVMVDLLNPVNLASSALVMPSSDRTITLQILANVDTAAMFEYASNLSIL